MLVMVKWSECLSVEFVNRRESRHVLCSWQAITLFLSKIGDWVV
jgi:hypothetical protein